MRRRALRIPSVRGLVPRPSAHGRARPALGWLGLVAALLLAPSARADTAPARSAWLAPTYQLLLTDAFEPSSRHGLGAAGSYEFHVSPTFNLGLTLAYRLYPGSVATQQLGYGVVLKHFFSPAWSRADGVYPFVDYGLLLQQSFVEERRGSAVSHDTRLGAGAVLRGWGVPLFVSVAGHYSRLSYFELAATWIPYLELGVGGVATF